MKEQYQSLERILESISLYLDVEPRYLLDHIRALPKPQDLADLQARVDSLLRENGELKTKAEEGKALRKEMEELRNRIVVTPKPKKTQNSPLNPLKTIEVT